MSACFDPDPVSRDAWDEMTGHNFYSSAGWLDFCALEHGGEFHAVVAGNGPAEVAVPVYSGGGRAGSPYDWNAELAGRKLPAVAADGLLVGSREGYQAHLLPSAPRPSTDAVTRLLAELRERAGDQACVAMYLDTEGVRLFRAAGVTAPAVLLEGDTSIPVPAGGFDAWLAGLTKKRRGTVRKEIAVFSEAGYRIQHLPLRECSEAIAPLAVSTEAKYDFQAGPEEDLASFHNHEKALGDAAMVVLCTLDDVPVGFCLYYEWQDTVFLRWTGFDYSRLRNSFEYFNLLYYEQLRRAAGRNIRWIHAGMKAMRAKVLRGAEIRPLWLLDLSATSPLTGAEQAVREHNAAYLADILADPTLAGGIADRAQWDAGTA
jgi:uncharacterized protein